MPDSAFYSAAATAGAVLVLAVIVALFGLSTFASILAVAGAVGLFAVIGADIVLRQTTA